MDPVLQRDDEPNVTTRSPLLVSAAFTSYLAMQFALGGVQQRSREDTN